MRCGDGSLYTGITNQVERRLSQHQNGTGAKYTRARGPIILAHREDGFTRSTASKREYEIKKLSRAQKLALIAKATIGS